MCTTCRSRGVTVIRTRCPSLMPSVAQRTGADLVTAPVVHRDVARRCPLAVAVAVGFVVPRHADHVTVERRPSRADRDRAPEDDDAAHDLEGQVGERHREHDDRDGEQPPTRPVLLLRQLVDAVQHRGSTPRATTTSAALGDDEHEQRHRDRALRRVAVREPARVLDAHLAPQSSLRAPSLCRPASGRSASAAAVAYATPSAVPYASRRSQIATPAGGVSRKESFARRYSATPSQRAAAAEPAGVSRQPRKRRPPTTTTREPDEPRDHQAGAGLEVLARGALRRPP